jgi:hypothetical protein
MELAWRVWGERRRRNIRLRSLAWAVASMMSPHVSKSDQSKIGVGRMFQQVTGGDLDEDEVLR